MNSIFKSAGIVLSCAMVLMLVLTACDKSESPVQTQEYGDRQFTQLSKPAAWTTLGTLNPTIDYNGGCYDWSASGGTMMNTTPMWVQESFDLSAYAGHNVRIIFEFNTGDAQYNKFEGWYLDDIDIDGTIDDVEGGAGNWTATGYWHISTARSYSTSNSWRYANSTTGNFQGAIIVDDCYDQANQGTLISDIVPLGASPSLSFWTLWQIEAVDAPIFDIMSIQIEDLGPIIQAEVDIKPGGCPNPLNTKAGGTFPVAIVGTSTFDVMNVNTATVTLEGVANGPQTPYYYDVSTPYGMMPMDCMDCNELGPDGLGDVTLYFKNKDVAATLDPLTEDGDCVVFTMWGRLNNGLWFVGHDVVKVLKK